MIYGFYFDHQTETLKSLPTVSVPNQNPGYFAHDSSKKQVFIGNGSNSDGHITVLDLNTDSNDSLGELKLVDQFEAPTGIVHLNLVKTNFSTRLYSSGYYNGTLAEYDVSGSKQAPSVTMINSKKYPNGAHTHSSTFDQVNQLVFAANKEEDRVVIGKFTDTGFQEIGEISIQDPRTVFFDETFRKLYLVTEVNNDSSLVQIYEIKANGEYILLGEKKMGNRGSDLKIDHSKMILSATDRHNNKEGLWLFPLSSGGTFNTGKSELFIPIPAHEPRSHLVSADGQYYFVTCNDSKNNDFDFFVFKVSFSNTNTPTDSQLLESIDFQTTSSYVSNILIPVTP